jgi:hypothetical protein
VHWLVLAAAAISLSGCGLPPVVTYASTAADIFSYLTTGKSVTDHGISMVLEKDCVLLRVLDGPICIEEEEVVVVVEEGIVAHRPARNPEAQAALPLP